MNLASKFLLGAIVSIFAMSESTRSQTYCAPSFSSGCAFNNYISSVNVGGMTNSASGCTQSNYLNKIATINAGDTISMTVVTAGWDGVNIYVDLNNDGDFVDSNENLYRHYKANTPPITYTFDITVPINALPGNHRFRVICGNGGSVSGNTNPCVSTGYGNYHDYTMKIVNNCPGDTLLTMFNATDTSADFTWGARSGVTGYQYAIDTVNQAPASGTFTVDTSVHIGGLTAGETYYFFVRTMCTAGMVSAWGIQSFVACARPESGISQSGSLGFCKGDSLVLSVTNFNSSNTYQWYRNSAKLNGKTGQNLTVDLFPGKYYYKVESLPGCVSESDKAQVSIYSLPSDTAELSQVGHLLITGGFITYDWFLNGIAIPNAHDSTYQVVANGTYFVSGNDTNGCTAGISNAIIIRTVGIENYTGSKTVRLFPNPVRDQINIQADWLGDINLLEIRNMNGQVMMSQQFNDPTSSIQLDVSDLHDGIYLLRIYTDHEFYQTKFIKNE